MEYTNIEVRQMYDLYDQMVSEYILNGNWTGRFLNGKQLLLDDLGDIGCLKEGDTMDIIFGSLENFIKTYDLRIS